MQMTFLILYAIGGLAFLGSMLVATHSNKGVWLNRHFGMPLLKRKVELIIFGEVTWFLLWLIGALISKSQLVLLLGVLPIVIGLSTLISYLYFIVKKKIGEKNNFDIANKIVIPVVKKWAEILPDGTVIENVYCYVKSHNNQLDGRITIEINYTLDQQIGWDQYVKILQKELRQPVLIEVRSGGKRLYPNWG
ncbi:hypothetical protein E8L90_03285 [Brevibacillus antibioticus]|uniref:Uncharacterized protein n=1 Tax=Brevibacillus antibioticus TaxID=2570228 RepID=A0A4U2Y3A4_9BACL|nr:hypothetical protein [Brevibacillus antibioticus]TKI54544.1 hypothetical protein E8L90_03285 [Brevibacillus antibioticus]